jgi:hypothetical protein
MCYDVVCVQEREREGKREKEKSWDNREAYGVWCIVYGVWCREIDMD